MIYKFPSNYGQGCCFLVAIDAALIPLVAGALKPFELERNWETEEEHERAYNAFAELQVCLMRTCVDDVIHSIDRLYMLMDSIYNGVQREVTSTDPLVIVPPIPTVPAPIYGGIGKIRQDYELRAMLDNAINGTPYTNYIDVRGIKQRLDEIRDAAAQGEFSPEEKAKLLADLAQVAGFFV